MAPTGTLEAKELGTTSGVALSLSLDEIGEAAFTRLAKTLPSVAAGLTDLAAGLTNLAADLVLVPAVKANGSLSASQLAADLGVVLEQVKDGDTRDRLAKLAAALLAVAEDHAVPHDKADDSASPLVVDVEGDDGAARAMLEHIGRVAANGHSFPVVVDPLDSEYKKEFSFDGDGAFRLAVRSDEVKADLSTGELASEGGALVPEQDALEKTDEKVGIFLRMPKAVADKVSALGDRSDPSPPHATLLFVGKVDEEGFEKVVEAAQAVAKDVEPFDVDVSKQGEFETPAGKAVPHLVPESLGDVSIEKLHEKLKKQLGTTGLTPVEGDPPAFRSHVSIARAAEEGELPEETFKAEAIEVWGEHGGDFGRVVITLGTGEITRRVSSTKVDVRILKSDVEEERTVLGVVLEPEEIDAQDDIYSVLEVRKTAFRFMERYQQFGLMHKQIVQSILPLESYLAPVDFELNGQKIKKGTWLIRVRVLDDGIWKKVKSGELTGFSIGGSAVRSPELVRAAA